MGARSRTFRGTALFAALALLAGALGVIAFEGAAYAARIPVAPGGVAARGGDAVGVMTITWQKPTNVAAGAKLDYLVATRNDSGAFGAAVLVGTARKATRPCTGVNSCGFRVYAKNATGTSPASAIATGTWTRPAVPTAKTIAPGPAVGRFALTWVAPVNTGGKTITNYLYDVQVNSTGAVLGPFSLGNVASASLPCSSTLATGGCLYRVYAQNVKGTSLTGTPVLGSWGLPAAPVINSVVGGRPEHAATINWRPGATTGGLTNTYTYEVSADGGPWVAGSGPLPASPTIATVPCSGNSLCSYRLTATNGKGASPVSNTMSAGYGISSKVLNLKARVSNLNLGSGVPTVAVTWDPPANSGGAPLDHYELRRCDGNCDETSTAWNTAPVETLGSTRSWATTCPVNLVTCSYEVRSVNDVGPGPWGSSARIAPFAPTNVTATTAAPAGSVTVTWSGPAESGLGLAGYRLYSCVTTSGCTNTANWQNTGLTIPPTATSATHNCGDGVQCTYKVAAIEQTSGASGASSGAVAAVGSSAAGAPQNLTAASGTTIGAVDLAWTAPSSGTFPITDYVFQRSVNNGPFSGDISTGGTTTSYTDTACGGYNVCTYKVAAVTAAGVGPYSTTATAEGANVPQAPTNLDANPGTSLGAVNITWQPPADTGGWPITGYFLERSLDGGTTWPQNWTLITSPSYTDTTCGQGVSCTYRVSAVNARGTGPASNTDTAVGPQLSPPQNLTATTSTNTLGGVVVSWQYPANDGGSAVLGYEFRFKQDSGAFSAWVSTGTGTGTTFTHTCFTDNVDRLCTYEVRAFNAIGTSSSSNQASAQGLTDHVSPSVSVVSPANGSATNNTTPPLSGTAGTAFGDASTVSVTIKQGTTTIQMFPSLPVTSGTWSTTAAALANGVYTVNVDQADWAGNHGTATNTFTVDTVAPTQTITGPVANTLYSSSGTTYTSSGINLWNGCGTAGFCGTAADTGGSGVANVKVSIQQVSTGQYWGGSSFNSASENLITTSGTTAWSLAFPVANFPAGGSYTVRAVAQDLAGNPSTGTSLTFFVDFNPGDTVFVSPSGNDGSNGLTTATPKATIAAALQAAQAALPVRNVVVVAANSGGSTYGALSISGAAFGNNKTTKGGFDPSTWLRKAPATTNVATISAGPTAVLVDAKTGIVFQQLNIQGSNASQPAGTTIYGLRAINGANVTIQRVAVGADSGVAGTTGTTGTAGASGGGGGTGVNGNEQGNSSCPGGSGAAGSAGTGGAAGHGGGIGGAAVCGGSGNNGQQGFFQVAGQGGGFGNGGGGSGSIVCSNASNGGGAGGGAAGATATSGGSAGTAFTAGTTWSGSNGTAGTAGTPGHGGGGGGAGGGHNATVFGSPVCGGFDTGGGGGGGGAAGDGGAAGGLGTAGGASFGIYANNSTVTIQDSSTVTAGNGGNGGAGGGGGGGGNGGGGGQGGSVGSSSQGNNPSGAPDGGAGGGGGGGGAGGAGSGGGGGTGGWAVAAFGTNSATITGGTTLNLTRGNGGSGGAGGAAASRGAGGTAGPIAAGSWSSTPNAGAGGATPTTATSATGATGTGGTACKLHVNGTCSIA